ncbi:Hypothetical protein LUCI_3050 [Lucifera butyrica]|uniref:Uncharacterized protein n=1 Tax=Lucifera butyrica TaxID=1351585 RepID=A0A498R9X1_9FIRM|nr:hypothetical protein [Lucifera butyrica]VBB07785.1 Hypothetical protein LUCI_3050 [Lucifera butyrica]
MKRIHMKTMEQFPQIPCKILWAIAIRMILTLVLTILSIMYSDYKQNLYMIREVSMFSLLVGPYLIAWAILCFKRKLGMQCLVIVSGFEFLVDMISLIFNYQVFGETLISYVQMGSGYINTPFSSYVFLYLGTNWKTICNPVESNLNNNSATLSSDDKKFYYSDLLATFLIIILGIWAYGSFNLGGNDNFKLFALIILLEGILIKLKCYWKWIAITIGVMLMREALGAGFNTLEDIILDFLKAIYPVGYGACMFSVAVLVYVIKRNIKVE